MAGAGALNAVVGPWSGRFPLRMSSGHPSPLSGCYRPVERLATPGLLRCTNQFGATSRWSGDHRHHLAMYSSRAFAGSAQDRTVGSATGTADSLADADRRERGERLKRSSQPGGHGGDEVDDRRCDVRLSRCGLDHCDAPLWRRPAGCRRAVPAPRRLQPEPCRDERTRGRHQHRWRARDRVAGGLRRVAEQPANHLHGSHGRRRGSRNRRQLHVLGEPRRPADAVRAARGARSRGARWSASTRGTLRCPRPTHRAKLVTGAQMPRLRCHPARCSRPPTSIAWSTLRAPATG